MSRLKSLGLLLSVSLPAVAAAQSTEPSQAFSYSATQCPSCEEWNAPQAPFKIFGNTWYVGTRGLSAILIHDPRGSILIDGGIPASAPGIIANIRALGFLVEDVRLIVNSHAHSDHAGGIAELQRASGADIAASPSSAPVIRSGQASRDDPQFAVALPFAPSVRVRTIADGETVHVGSLAITAHFTPGHTAGGTTWSWRSCEGSVCEDLVYADSQTPVSADGFFFTHSKEYPNVLADFERGFTTLESLKCDVLITPHPGASNFFERVSAHTLVDSGACKRYAAKARAALAARVAKEKSS
ncbi:MAG: esterase [Gemmatimonadetes bacterium]|nr:esterase [Gemmatimonadota bacterium]